MVPLFSTQCAILVFWPWLGGLGGYHLSTGLWANQNISFKVIFLLSLVTWATLDSWSLPICPWESTYIALWKFDSNFSNLILYHFLKLQPVFKTSTIIQTLSKTFLMLRILAQGSQRPYLDMDFHGLCQYQNSAMVCECYNIHKPAQYCIWLQYN